MGCVPFLASCSSIIFSSNKPLKLCKDLLKASIKIFMGFLGFDQCWKAHCLT